MKTLFLAGAMIFFASQSKAMDEQGFKRCVEVDLQKLKEHPTLSLAVKYNMNKTYLAETPNETDIADTIDFLRLLHVKKRGDLKPVDIAFLQQKIIDAQTCGDLKVNTTSPSVRYSRIKPASEEFESAKSRWLEETKLDLARVARYAAYLQLNEIASTLTNQQYLVITFLNKMEGWRFDMTHPNASFNDHMLTELKEILKGMSAPQAEAALAQLFGFSITKEEQSVREMLQTTEILPRN
jgi:hypothetical protein